MNVLHTARLTLRPLRADDVDAVMTLACDPRVMASLGGAFGEPNLARPQLAHIDEHGYGRCVVKRGAQFVGLVRMMLPRIGSWLCATAITFVCVPVSAEVRVGYAEALTLSQKRAPIVAVSRATEGVAEADSRAGGLYPNPTLNAGTSSATVRLSVGATLPLLLLGQRGAALDAGRAEYLAAKIDTQISLSDVRAATAHSFVALWLAERSAAAREDAALVAHKLESAVAGRVELGSAPELEGLRAHAETLRADMDARSAADLVEASAADLAAWVGTPFDERLRVNGDPDVPQQAPPIADLWPRVGKNPSVQRAFAEVRASEARATSERVQVRPLITLDVGADFGDRTLAGETNYRAQLGVEVPIFNQRGPLIEREERRGAAARSKTHAEQVRLGAELIIAYRTFRALTQQAQTLATGVLPAAAAAARATEESYSLGRAPLVAVLDSERARIEASLALIESQAARANAWIDVERAIGVQ